MGFSDFDLTVERDDSSEENFFAYGNMEMEILPSGSEGADAQSEYLPILEEALSSNLGIDRNCASSAVISSETDSKSVISTDFNILANGEYGKAKIGEIASKVILSYTELAARIASDRGTYGKFELRFFDTTEGWDSEERFGKQDGNWNGNCGEK